MMNQKPQNPKNPIHAALDYIDTAAREILNDAAQNEDFLHFAHTDANDFGETFNDRIESAAAGAPITIFPSTNDWGDTMNLLHDLITARIYQLLFAGRLTDEI